MAARKIQLDTSLYCLATGNDVGGCPNPNCDHDYPPESEKPCPEGDGSHWTCRICGNVRCYEMYD